MGIPKKCAGWSVGDWRLCAQIFPRKFCKTLLSKQGTTFPPLSDFVPIQFDATSYARLCLPPRFPFPEPPIKQSEELALDSHSQSWVLALASRCYPSSSPMAEANPNRPCRRSVHE